MMFLDTSDSSYLINYIFDSHTMQQYQQKKIQVVIAHFYLQLYNSKNLPEVLI